MCLELIRRRLYRGYYRRATAAEFDIRQLGRNCAIYNQDGAPIVEVAGRLVERLLAAAVAGVQEGGGGGAEGAPRALEAELAGSSSGSDGAGASATWASLLRAFERAEADEAQAVSRRRRGGGAAASAGGSATTRMSTRGAGQAAGTTEVSVVSVAVSTAPQRSR